MDINGRVKETEGKKQTQEHHYYVNVHNSTLKNCYNHIPVPRSFFLPSTSAIL